jgi:1-acyl-sn-glycerol-3-phosphate acyltransferase
MFLLRPFYLLIGIFAMACFVVSLLVFFFIYLFIFATVPKNRAAHVAHTVSRAWGKTCFLFMFIPTRVEGKDKIDKNKTYVFVANHQSQLDIPLYAIACKNTFKFLAKAELTKIPLLGFLIKRLYLTVDRNDKTDRSKSLLVMKEALSKGVSIFLCPEGTRNRTQNPLLELKDGAFKVAIETQLPIAVLTVIDTKNRNRPKNPLELMPGAVHAIWHDPIETKGLSLNDIPALKEKVRIIMMDNLKAYHNKGITAFKNYNYA